MSISMLTVLCIVILNESTVFGRVEKRLYYNNIFLELPYDAIV